MSPALQTDREKLEEALIESISVFNDAENPRDILESIKRIRELRSRLRLQSLGTELKEVTP